MSVFREYAEYYDILYQDKDYSGEIEFVLNCLGPVPDGAALLVESYGYSGRHLGPVNAPTAPRERGPNGPQAEDFRHPKWRRRWTPPHEWTPPQAGEHARTPWSPGRGSFQPR